jgi:hypothetical protein
MVQLHDGQLDADLGHIGRILWRAAQQLRGDRTATSDCLAAKYLR